MQDSHTSSKRAQVPSNGYLNGAAPQTHLNGYSLEHSHESETHEIGAQREPEADHAIAPQPGQRWIHDSEERNSQRRLDEGNWQERDRPGLSQASAAIEYSTGVAPSELAERLNLKPQTVNGKIEYHGANPFEAGATKDGFILNHDGTAFDRKNVRRYTSHEIAELAGLAPSEYEPCRQWRERNGNHSSNFNGAHQNGHDTPKASAVPKAAKVPFDWNKATIHEYRDELGGLLFQVGRVGSGDAKSIRQRRPDGRGGWLHQLDDARRVLYLLPEVLQAHTVLIVEGEKAADAINERLREVEQFGSAGYVATTAPHGAGKFRAEYADALKGKAVAVLPDNDDQGTSGADATLRVLDSQGIKSKRVELPDLPHKGDAADYLANGNEVLQLLALCDGAPIWTSEAASTRSEAPRFELFDFKALAKIPRPEWLVRGLLIEKIASVISADTGGFKSFFALDMALCVALGRPFMGRDTKRGGVVYVAAEGFYTIHDRATAWAMHHDCELPENFHALKVPVNLGDEATVAAFADTVENLSPDLVILDTLSQCAVGANENDNGQMADFVRGMMALCGRIGAHVSVLHHNGKASGTFRGAGSIKANVDAHISLERPEGDETNTVFVRCEKQRGRPFEPFALRGVEVELPFVDEYGDVVTSLVFEPCGDEVAAKSAKHPNAQKADKTSAALLEVFDEVAREAAALGIEGVKVGFWKEKAEEADPPICSESAFWRHRKALEKSGAIQECGTHNGSVIFQRKRSTVTTVTTVKTLNDSSDSEPKTNCQKVLSVLSHPFRGDSTDSTDSDRPEVSAKLPEMPTARLREKQNPQVDSEAYGAQRTVTTSTTSNDSTDEVDADSIFDDESE